MSALVKMKKSLIVEKVFNKIYGKPCWNVRPGYGSFLTFEFGNPRLVIREPKKTIGKIPDKIKKILEARRNVTIRGDWYLWIYCCSWNVLLKNKIIGDSTSKRKMKLAASFLDGQKLTKVTICARTPNTVFEFDLGARLETKSYDKTSEQWMLYEPKGKVFTIRADNTYCYEDAKTDPRVSSKEKFVD